MVASLKDRSNRKLTPRGQGRAKERATQIRLSAERLGLATNHVVTRVLSPLELELVVLHHRQQLDRVHTQLHQVRHLGNDQVCEQTAHNSDLGKAARQSGISLLLFKI